MRSDSKDILYFITEICLYFFKESGKESILTKYIFWVLTVLLNITMTTIHDLALTC